MLVNILGNILTSCFKAKGLYFYRRYKCKNFVSV